ncbi:hypothetical protein LTR17_014793 [Elasticomyces elasticus]|nr:hypothetical protein LTR17_014793 [Elasticomyces elasticus]
MAHEKAAKDTTLYLIHESTALELIHLVDFVDQPPHSPAFDDDDLPTLQLASSITESILSSKVYDGAHKSALFGRMYGDYSKQSAIHRKDSTIDATLVSQAK